MLIRLFWENPHPPEAPVYTLKKWEKETKTRSPVHVRMLKRFLQNEYVVKQTVALTYLVTEGKKKTNVCILP